MPDNRWASDFDAAGPRRVRLVHVSGLNGTPAQPLKVVLARSLRVVRLTEIHACREAENGKCGRFLGQ
jgi:hypothetical protein